MTQQQQQSQPRPPPVYQQITSFHQQQYIDMRDAPPPPPPSQPQPPQPAMFVPSHQTPYVTNAHMYQQPTQPPPHQIHPQYMPYQHMDYQPYHPNHFNGPQCFMQRTALARGADGRDHSDLLKTNPATELSVRNVNINSPSVFLCDCGMFLRKNPSNSYPSRFNFSGP